MKQFYVIAKEDREPNQPHSSHWPKIIGYSYKDSHVYFEEGKGHGLAATKIPFARAIRPQWFEIFASLDALWFIDLIKNTSFSSEQNFLDELKNRIGKIELINI